MRPFSCMSTIVLCLAIVSAGPVAVHAQGLDDGLVAYWPLDGSAVDATGNGNDGTVAGAVPAPGKIGGALQFDGVDDEVSIETPAAGLTGVTAGPHSYSAWVLLMQQPGIKFVIDGSDLDRSDILGDQRGIRFINSAAPTFKWVTDRRATVDHSLQASTALSLAAWHHIAATFDGSEGRIYVDCELSGTMANTGSPTAAKVWKIGNVSAGGTGTGFFPGMIDELRVYNRALSPDEVCQLSSDLSVHYPFDGNAIDASGSGRHGTEQGQVSYQPGKYADGIYLNGQGYVLAPAINTTNSLTVSAWVRADVINPTYVHTIAYERAESVDDYCGPHSAGNYGLQIYQGRFAFETSTTTNGVCTHHPRIFHDSPAETGAFYCVAGVFNRAAQTMRLYVNGERVAETGTGEALRTRADAVLRIGQNHPLATQRWIGVIDDVRVYGRALTDGEIVALCPVGPADVSAGADRVVDEGTTGVPLAGSTSSPDGATFFWEQIGGDPVPIQNATHPDASFDAPWLAGGTGGNQTFSFRLTVTLNGISESDTVDIVVKNINHAPVADAGDDDFVNEGTPVTLDGRDSYDPDTDRITYEWTQISEPTVVLQNPDTATPTFTAPLLEGGVGDAETLTFRLTVSDGDLSRTDDVLVTVEQVNHAPVADAGEDQTREEATAVTLNGTGSTDPDGDPITYVWTRVWGPEVTLLDATSGMPGFEAPIVDPGGADLTFQLVVMDGGGLTDADRVVIHIRNTNDPPACHLARPSIDLLWPPNHKFRSVSIEGVTDPQDDAVAITIVGVTQDEPTNDLGDGDTAPDAVLEGDTVLLRAERSGEANGRVYRVSFTADDSGPGGFCTGSVVVGVPKNARTTPVDDGQQYESTQEW